MTQSRPEPTTTDAGIPVASDEHSLTVGRDGPIVLNDHYLIEQMAQFNRERIPERQPHAKGGGAFGTFEVTHDVSQYTKAAVFQPGARTKMLARFSTVAGERGSPDTWRDPRGFALKFYTPEGDFDLVGNNTPVFYAPNSYGGPAADPERYPETATWAADGEMVRAAATLHAEDDDWGQAGTLARDVLDAAARERLVHNIAGHLSQGVSQPVLERAYEYWGNVDADLGRRVRAAVEVGG